MNAKKTNWLFTVIILLNFLTVVVVAYLAEYKNMQMDTIPALLLSQALLFVPAILFLVGSKTKIKELIAVEKELFN